MKPLVAIVGRPNVGKSMLFNKLVGQRLSIVEDTPGVTRDRLYAEAEWLNRKFDLVDTGGIEPSADSEILAFMREQAEIAIQNATGHRVPLRYQDRPDRLRSGGGQPAAALGQAGGAGGKQNGPGGTRPTRTSMNFIIWAWATPFRSPPSTATGPESCGRVS